MNIQQLIDKYEANRDSYLSAKYNETLLRSDFLDPLFELLDWDIKNHAAKPTNEREVILEEGLKAKVSEHYKKPDYTFRLFSERKFFLEAKKPSVQIESNPETAKQIRRYGFTAKLKISVLSNFEYLAIYDCSYQVEEGDSANKALIRLYHYTEYIKNFDEIKEFLGKDSVYSGRFDKTWEHIEEQLKLFSVDKLFLGQISEWRLLLGKDIYTHSPDISEQQLNDTVQSYINSIIFLRVCEDRNIELYQTLLGFATQKDFKALIAKFIEADRKYNSGLFDLPLREQIVVNAHSIFWKIIQQLYYPESPYSFSVFSSDILGYIYEVFLAQKLYVKNNIVVLENKPEHIDRDIITTPTFIIRDILRQTVVPFFSGKNYDSIFESKIADIACGSGAFLLEAFQLISDMLIDYYIQNDKKKLIPISVNTYKLPFLEKRKLLENCIYGVDKDYNAVQATKFGLLLKLLEGEDGVSVSKHAPILPDISGHISYGNSLLNSQQVPARSRPEINPFDFQDSFDIIIGNPPYMTPEDMNSLTPLELPLYKKFYDSAYKQFDKYFLFIEKGFNLLGNNGKLGFIIPAKFAKVGAGMKLRKLLGESKSVTRIVSFGANQIFEEKTTYTCLLILNKAEHDSFEYAEIKDLSAWKVRYSESDSFDEIITAELENDGWILVPGYLKNAYNKINSLSISLEELVGGDGIFNGIQTSANNVYVHRPTSEDKNYFYFKKDDEKWKIEKEVTKPYYQTSAGEDNLNTYRPFKPNSFVIYPYHKTRKGIEFIDIKSLQSAYPFAYEYLQRYKDVLANPKRDIKPAPETSDEWYRFGRHQSLDKCDVPEKIIVGVLSIGDKYAIDFYSTLISSGGTAGYCMITLPDKCPYSIYYIQALLNSKYLEWYSALIGEIFRGGYIARGTKVLKKLPIRKIDFNNATERKLHDEIVNLQKSLIDMQGEIDKVANNDKRKLNQLVRQFSEMKKELKIQLKDLYALGTEDEKIPLIKELYAAN